MKKIPGFIYSQYRSNLTPAPTSRVPQSLIFSKTCSIVYCLHSFIPLFCNSYSLSFLPIEILFICQASANMSPTKKHFTTSISQQFAGSAFFSELTQYVYAPHTLQSFATYKDCMLLEDRWHSVFSPQSTLNSFK